MCHQGTDRTVRLIVWGDTRGETVRLTMGYTGLSEAEVRFLLAVALGETMADEDVLGKEADQFLP